MLKTEFYGEKVGKVRMVSSYFGQLRCMGPYLIRG